MVGPAWNTDSPGSDGQISTNVRAVMGAIAADAPNRRRPNLAMAARWHRALYEGLAVPSTSYRGNPRNSDPAHPDLIGYEVRVGAKEGLPSAQVPDALTRFISQLRRAVQAFDGVLPVGVAPSTDADVLDVVTLAAYAHGEWVRIHPFANGNGRTARIWANWVAMRYGLPPFVVVKPRPAGGDYEAAAMASMGAPPLFTGNHDPMTAVFVDLLHECTDGH